MAVQEVLPRIRDISGRMKRKWWGLLLSLVCFLLLLFTHSALAASSHIPTVKNGDLNAPNWSFFDAPPLEIVGEWEVIWNDLVSPENFDIDYQDEHFKLPSRWNGHIKGQGKKSFGTATFRARLHLPDYNRQLSFQLIAPHAAYRIYIDGVLVINNGNVSRTPENFRANYVSRSFKARSGDSEIVLQVANFSHAYGGPGHALALWDQQHLQKFLGTLSLLYGLVLGVMFTIGLFHFILFLANPKDKTNRAIHFWFFALCIIIVYRIQGIIPLFHTYFPTSGYWENLRFTYASLYAAPAVYLLFFKSVFPDYFPKKLTQFLVLVCLIGLGFTFIVSEYYYTATRNFSILLNIIAIIYAMIFTGRALWARQTGALTMTLTNMVFLATALNDAFVYTDQGTGYDMTPFGIAALGLGYSYALLLRLQSLFTEAQNTSLALETLNTDLEQQVHDRTRSFKSAAAKAENAAHERARFIAAASHDLRQPLHALALFNAALKARLRSTPHHTLAQQQENAITNLGSLLQDTLDAAQLDTQQTSPRWKPVKLVDFFAKLRESFELRAQARQVTLKFEHAQDSIVTDSAMLQRIVSNLLDNALKAARSAVKITAHKDSSHWVFKIEDDGPGIADTDAERIFAPYVSLGDAPPDQDGGYGLGLYVVKEFSERLGGHVEVHSRQDKKGRTEGTQFVLTLPRKNIVDTVAHEEHILPEHLKSLQGAKILVLDDEMDILNAMATLLENWECSVQTANTLAHALDIAANGFEPDIVLADYHLQGHTGLEALSALNEAFTHNQPATMIITGATETSVLTQIKDAQIPVLGKPIDPEKFAAVLVALLAKT
jgi:signal transduction histidine kinase/ActR/RegA family two-component response regulator